MLLRCCHCCCRAAATETPPPPQYQLLSQLKLQHTFFRPPGFAERTAVSCVTNLWAREPSRRLTAARLAWKAIKNLPQRWRRGWWRSSQTNRGDGDELSYCMRKTYTILLISYATLPEKKSKVRLAPQRINVFPRRAENYNAPDKNSPPDI